MATAHKLEEFWKFIADKMILYGTVDLTDTTTLVLATGMTTVQKVLPVIETRPTTGSAYLLAYPGTVTAGTACFKMDGSAAGTTTVGFIVIGTR